MSISDSWATTVAPTTNVTKQAAEEARSWIPGVIVFIAALLAFIILATPVQLNGAPYKVTYNETTSDIKCIANEDLPDPRYADEDKVEGAAKRLEARANELCPRVQALAEINAGFEVEIASGIRLDLL